MGEVGENPAGFLIGDPQLLGSIFDIKHIGKAHVLSIVESLQASGTFAYHQVDGKTAEVVPGSIPVESAVAGLKEVLSILADDIVEALLLRTGVFGPQGVYLIGADS
jgi:hypothetical protein